MHKVGDSTCITVIINWYNKCLFSDCSPNTTQNCKASGINSLGDISVNQTVQNH